ncbi:hypothetical protein C8Q78DRAFT_970753 [Trametes maxima]|nr:hypothetical protein C8Q78DRAFT_970753 [Trametes maxima]
MSQGSILRSPAATISSLSSSGSEDSRFHDVLSYLPPASKVITTAPARIYHSAFNADPDAWTPTGLRGTLVFGRNRSSASRDNALDPGEVRNAGAEHEYWFRLVDVDSGKGIVWLHQIPSSFDYRADKPFFHVFSGCSRMFGFRFDEDADAERFVKCVASRVQITSATPKSKSKPKSKLSRSSASILTTSTSSPRHVSPSMISAPSPGTFVHVAHISVDHDGHIEASPNVCTESGWTLALEEMQGFGVDITNVCAGPQDKNANMGMDARGPEGVLAGVEKNLELPLTTTTATGSASVASSGSACSTSMRSRRDSGAHWAGCVASNSSSPGLKGRFLSRRRAPGPEA